MTEPIWLSVDLVVAIHGEQLREFGGPAGLRDPGMLESALGRPRNKWSFGEEDLAVLAAAYAFGVARNHPFVDGNKRAALLSLITFLGLNGIDFEAPNSEAVVMIQGLASGEIDEEGLARWIRDNWPVEAKTTVATKAKPKAAKRGSKRAMKTAKKLSPSAPKKRR
jgi:death-on-curing protein